MSQSYDDLESQIGDLGGESAPTGESLKGRKLTHKAAYGAREDLSDDEQNSMDNFLKKTKKTVVKSDEE